MRPRAPGADPLRTHHAFDEKLLRSALGRFASGVTVVTSARGDEIAGTTVAAFASLSLKPPLVLVCLEEHSATRRIIEASRVFAVNVLSASQQALSERFARPHRAGEPSQFEGIPFRRGATSSPILDGCHAFTDCRVAGVHEGGDHRIYVGRVESLGFGEGGSRPLLYHDGRYRHLK
jgi:flavin reductase (DIM6/NTAB) family NADH-FMN oxidoreductase RutF